MADDVGVPANRRSGLEERTDRVPAGLFPCLDLAAEDRARRDAGTERCLFGGEGEQPAVALCTAHWAMGLLSGRRREARKRRSAYDSLSSRVALAPGAAGRIEHHGRGEGRGQRREGSGRGRLRQVPAHAASRLARRVVPEGRQAHACCRSWRVASLSGPSLGTHGSAARSRTNRAP